MPSPKHERDWLTLRAAFGHRSAARAMALQVRTAKDQPTEFRLISCLEPDGAWRLEATFSRSDLAYRAYQARAREARLTDYFDQPPRQTPPRWIIPSPEGAFLSPPPPPSTAAAEPSARPSFWARLMHPTRWG